MVQVLAQQELLFPRLYWNLKAAMFPVMNIQRTGVESLVFGKGQGQGGVGGGKEEEGEEDEEEDGL